MGATDDAADDDNAPMTEAEAIKHFATMQQAADDRAFFTDGELASVTTALERLGLDHDRLRRPQGSPRQKRPPRLQAMAHDARDSHLFSERAAARQ